MIGLVFLGACVAAGESIMRHMAEGPLATALHESLLVGGWVAMWRPMEIFLYDWWPILSQRRLYDRLSRISVRLVYRNHASGLIDHRLTRSGTSTPRAAGGN